MDIFYILSFNIIIIFCVFLTKIELSPLTDDRMYVLQRTKKAIYVDCHQNCMMGEHYLYFEENLCPNNRYGCVDKTILIEYSYSFKGFVLEATRFQGPGVVRADWHQHGLFCEEPTHARESSVKGHIGTTLQLACCVLCCLLLSEASAHTHTHTHTHTQR